MSGDPILAGWDEAANDARDPILAGWERERRARLAPGMALSAQTSPDSYAKAMGTSKDIGVPAQVVARNPEMADRKQRAQALARIRAENPALTDWLGESPDNLALVNDDLDTTDRLTQAVGFALNFSTAPGRGVARSRGGESASVGALAAFSTAAETALDMAHNGPLGQIGDLSHAIMAAGFGETAPAQAWKAAGLPLMEVSEALDETRDVSAYTREQMSAIAADVGGWPSAADWLANPAAAFEQAMAHGVQSSAVSAPLMAAGVATRNPAIGAAFMAAPTGTMTYSAMRSQGVPMGRALAAGGVSAAMEFAGEKVAFDALLRPAWRKSLLIAPPTEYAQEFVTQIGQESVENITLGVEGDPWTMLQRAHDAALTGAFMGGSIAGARAAIEMPLEYRQMRRNSGDLDRLDKLERSAKAVAGLGAVVEAAKASKLSQRAPEKLEELVGKLADATVYVPASAIRTLYQGDAVAFTAELTGDGDALALAGEHGDVAIPMAKWVAAVSRMDNSQEWVRHARTDPEGLSAAEVENDLAEWEAQFDTSEAAERAEPSDEPSARERIEKDVFGMLHATGRYRESDAELQARLVARGFHTLGERTGRDPWELYARYKLRINGTGGNQVAPDMDALLLAARTGDMPSRREAYGASLVEALVALGGIRDHGGELRGMDARRVRPGLVSNQGMGLDAAREWAVENGYLRDEGAETGGVTTSGIDDLLNAVSDELSDVRAIFSDANRNERLASFREAADELSRAIDDNERLRGMSADEFAALSNQEMWAILNDKPTVFQKMLDSAKAFLQGAIGGRERVVAQSAKPEDILGTPEFRRWFGDRSIEQLEADYAALTNEKGKNVTDGGRRIDTDLVRELAPDYVADRSLSPQLHLYASALTKTLFARALARPVAEGREPVVEFTAGGGGSGKSTATKDVLGESNADIIYDGTLSNMDRALEDVEAALENRGVRVAFVYRSPENSAATAIQRAIDGRRPVPVEVLAQAHSGAPEVVKAINNKYADDERVSVVAINNDGAKGEAHPMPVEEIPDVQQEQALEAFRGAIKDAREAGRLDQDLYAAFTGTDPGLGAQVGGRPEPGRAERGRNPVTQDPAAGGVSASGDLNFGVESTADFDAAGYRPSVVDWARERFGDMVAPNGDPAWQNFTRWFGDSQVVDAEGRPLVVYHGSTSSHDTFQIGEYEPGVHFGTANQANNRRFVGGASTSDGQVYPVYLSIQNPLRMRDTFGQGRSEATWLQMQASGLFTSEQMDSLADLDPEQAGTKAAPTEGPFWRQVRSMIEAAGYDGIVYENRGERENRAEVDGTDKPTDVRGYRYADSWIGFDPAKVKSSTANNGDFDPANPSILFQPSLRVDGRGTQTIEHNDGQFVQRGAQWYLAGDNGRPQDFATLGAAKQAASERGAEVLADEPIEGQKPTWSVVLPEVVAREAMASRSLRQADGGSQAPRGQLGIGPDRSMSVDLFAKADRSTFLHETGHFFLEVMADLAVEDAGIAADFDAILQWGDVAGETAQDRLATWRTMPIEEQRHLHEGWAEGWEQYLLEGKAPAPELRGMFGRFRAWLRALYGELRRARIPLTDDVRAVMDRLVATDEEIEVAQVRQGYVPLFDRDQGRELGLTDKQWEAYAASLEAATEEARQEVFAKLYEAHQREAEKWWKEELAGLRDGVIEAFEATPAVKVWRVLSGRGPEGSPEVKLDRDAVYALFPERSAWIKARILPLGVYTRTGGVHPDVAASMLGYGSGMEMIEAMSAIPPNGRARADYFDALARDMMRGKHPSPMMDGTLPEVAQDAVHRNRRVQALEQELGLLSQLAEVPTPSPRVLNEIARRAVAKKQLRALRPSEALAAERRAARAAIKAAAKGDYAAALQAKREQVLQAAMYRHVRDAQERAGKSVKYLRRMGQDKARAKLGKAGGSYQEQVDALLERFDFKPMTGKAADRRASFVEWVKAQEADGVTLDIAPKILNEANRKPYQSMSVEELGALRDAVKQIEHLAGRWNKVMASQDGRQFDEVADSVANGIEANHDTTAAALDLTESFASKFGRGLSAANSWLTKPEFLFRWLDGENPGGATWRALFKPFADAEFAEQAMMVDLSAKLREIFGQYDRGKLATEKLFVAEAKNKKFAGNFTRSSLLAFGLNWGNADNRVALLEGYGLTEAQGHAVMARLTERDLDTIQAVWDLIDSLWPQVAALQKRVTGLAPEKVQAAPFVVNGRPMRGGYYPLKADSNLSWPSFKREEKANVENLYGGSWVRAQTRHGHTTNRVGFGGQPVKLDLSVATMHLSNVVHDLTHREAVLDVAQLLDDGRVRGAIESAAGRAAYQRTQEWLRAVAQSETFVPTSYIEKLLRHARQGATVAYMGLKVTTAIVQPLGYTQTIDVVGEKYAALGLKDFLAHGVERTKFAMERSKVLPYRQRTFDRDVADTLKRITDGSRKDDVHRMFFYFIGMMDMGVSVPSWLAGYRKAIEGQVEGIEAGVEADAIAYADSVIRMSQSSGSLKDLASIQRGGEGLRIFTMFYSYFNVLYNLMQRRARATRTTSDLPRLAAGMMWLWFVPSVLSELVAGRGPEDDEDWVEWFARKGFMFATYPANTVPVVRDIVSGIEQKYWGYSASPAFDALESIVTVGGEAFAQVFDEDEEFSRSDARSVVMAASYWGHLPGAQMWITGEYMYDVATGEEQPESLAEFAEGMAFSRPASERD